MTPKAVATALTPLHAASAFARSPPSVNVVVMIETTAGASIAAPRPCSARNASSIPGVVASPQSSDATVNSAMPSVNSLLRPKRSPARPPRSRKPPKTNT